jgi:hypothetical protein
VTKGERAESLGKELVDRLVADVTSALKRHPTQEAKLAGVVRALAPHSAALRQAIGEAAAVLAKRGSFGRPLYAACVRSLAETEPRRAAPVLAKALLANDEAGGFATLSAACFVKEPALAAPLARVAASRHPHVAFAAEVARVARGESEGAHLVAIAPKIKESHRISLCVEMFIPLSRGMRLPRTVGPAIAVLRDAERHLGRWLVLAEVATLASDPGPLEEARSKAKSGPGSARAAWSLVAWALSGSTTPPSTRPTVEVVARLSDRPSADRDTAFLFRLAAARAPTVRPMLEGATRVLPLADEVGIRAASYLLHDHGREEMRGALEQAARAAKREDLRGFAVAALWDAGAVDLARELANDTIKSRSLQSAAWAALVRAAATNKWDRPLIDEPSLRRIQWGWLE